MPELRGLRLPDGRLLSYREFGDPMGSPVVNNHGGLVCGLDICTAHEAAQDLGVRIIAPDRPGIGRSTKLPGRTTGGWDEDVAALADHLNINRFAVFGWSLGGPYALALAAKLPGRVTGAAVVAGALPLHPPSRIWELNGTDRRLVGLCDRRPRVARVAFGAIGLAARRFPALIDNATAHTLCPSDQAAFKALPAGAFGQWMAHAMAQPAGMVEEYLAWLRPWGFRLDDVRRPTTVWQGAADTLVPIQWGRATAEAIPAATFRVVPDEGHFLAFPRWSVVLSDLVAS